MRSPREVSTVLALFEQGFNASQISQLSGVPHSTVRKWCRGAVPRSFAAPGSPRACESCGHPEHDYASLPECDYAYLLGLYLGDGHIAPARRGVYVLRLTLDSRYPGIVQECCRAIGAVMPRNRVHVAWSARGRNMALVSSYSKQWPCLFPQHGAGPKHKRRIVLTGWQETIAERNAELLLRGLIHSDGCRSLNRIRGKKATYAYPRYTFSNASADIRGIFCTACDLLGIEWRRMNARNISVARRESVAELDRFVGPKR